MNYLSIRFVHLQSKSREMESQMENELIVILNSITRDSDCTECDL